MNKFAFLSVFKEKIKSMFSDKKKSVFLVVAIVIVAVCLLMLSNYETSLNKKEIEEDSGFSVLEYSENLEKKLQSMIVGIDEIESASVMVMVESTPKTEYLTEIVESTETDESGSTSSTKSTTVVFEKDGSVYTPIALTTLMPKVTGVLIVVNNISASTKLSLINSVAIVLNVDVSRISILQKN